LGEISGPAGLFGGVAYFPQNGVPQVITNKKLVAFSKIILAAKRLASRVTMLGPKQKKRSFGGAIISR
jgi:hypothetical protein